MVNGESDHPGDELVFRLLDEALRALRDDLRPEDYAGTPAPAQAIIESMRSSQLRLVAQVPEGGIRVTEMAQRLGMTKQSLGEFARVLEERGLLEMVPDPTDGRARLLMLTADGRAAAEYGTRAVRRMEDRWRTEIGAEDWAVMRRALHRIGRPPPA